ncbi:MAG: HD domain-containing protein [Candidatus Zixiibacteriota bacterium]|nr:MAG: HD domain-containing protein [candidate division Zixibacteria bacterium]
MSNTADILSRTLAGPREAKLLNAFFVLYKTVRILEANNETVKNQLGSFWEAFEPIASEYDYVAIKTVHDRYFINDKMVRFDDRGLSGAATVVAEWKTLGVGGVRFEAAITREEMGKFFTFMSSIRPKSENLESLAERLKEHGLANVTLLAQHTDSDESLLSEEVRKQFRTMARASFFQAVSVMQEVVVNARNDREINIAKTRRVVHGLIDHITRDESSLIELTAIKDFDDYTYAHSTNVCVYALTMGVRLGMDRARLSQLGFSALFHDIGKVKLPADLIRKPDAFDENDWIQMQRHPLLGAKTILRNLKLDIHTARAARGAFEHHINSDFTGYPVLHYERRRPNLFSRIIAIVDSFDALTSGRLYLKKPIPPDVVMKKLRFQMKVKFDPFLLKLFNDVIGIYPAGTLVLLTTDEIALVLTNNEKDKARPYIKIVGNREGLLKEPLWVDLALPENADRRIIRVVEPERYGLDVKDFILQD